jgi:hypothetical protein
MTYIVLYIRQSDEVIPGRTSPTRECDDQFTPTTDLHFRGPGGAHRSLRLISQASLPLSATSSASGCATPCSRTQSGFHRQASSRVGDKGSEAGSTSTLFDQPVGSTGFAARTGPRSGSWLNPDASDNCFAKFIFCRIVMGRKNCLKFTAGWCRSRNPPALPHGYN